MADPRTTPTTSLSSVADYRPLYVFWEEGEYPNRQVVKACAVCYAARWPAPQMIQGRDGMVPCTPMIVSPSGVAHLASTGETTDCGKDATREDWWHRL